MSDNNEKVYAAYSVAGGAEENMTLKEARSQVEAWESKGYSSYVGHMHDPEWEDVKVTAPITPLQVVESLGADRETLTEFMLKMFDVLDWAYAEHPDGSCITVYYTPEGV